jgi:ferric enterobactin receptor
MLNLRIADKLSLRSDIALREINNIVPGVASVAGFTYKVNLNANYQFDKGLMAEIFGYINQLATSYGSGFNQSTLRLVPLRSFGLTLSYRFGKQQTKDPVKDEDFSPLAPPGN